jgi:hypothetical protein
MVLRRGSELCDYTGFDLGKGKGVDIVCNYADFPLPCHIEAGLTIADANVIVSSEALEHDDAWRKTLGVMLQCLRCPGMLLLTLASAERPEHGTDYAAPGSSPFTHTSYSRITVEEFMQTLSPWQHFSHWVFEHDKQHGDIYFAGWRL